MMTNTNNTAAAILNPSLSRALLARVADERGIVFPGGGRTGVSSVSEVMDAHEEAARRRDEILDLIAAGDFFRARFFLHSLRDRTLDDGLRADVYRAIDFCNSLIG